MATMSTILEIYFEFLLNRKANWLDWKYWADVDHKKLKSFHSEIQDGCHGGHLENLFWASSPEQKDQLMLNLVGNIRATAAILKIYFELLNWKANWLETSLEVWR